MSNHKVVNGVVIQLNEQEEAELVLAHEVWIAGAGGRVRDERDTILVGEVDPIVSNSLRWNDMSDTKRTEWTNYRQALLDIPEQSGFPNDITWPTKPN